MVTNIICATQSNNVGGGATNTLYAKAGVAINQTRTGDPDGLLLQTFNSSLSLAESRLKVLGQMACIFSVTQPAPIVFSLGVGGLTLDFNYRYSSAVGTKKLAYDITVDFSGGVIAAKCFFSMELYGDTTGFASLNTGAPASGLINLVVKTLTTTSIINHFGAVEVRT